jgi:hypothetical protein
MLTSWCGPYEVNDPFPMGTTAVERIEVMASYAIAVLSTASSTVAQLATVGTVPQSVIGEVATSTVVMSAFASLA